MHIGIAGNIGCGKTTLTRMLAEHYGNKKLEIAIVTSYFHLNRSVRLAKNYIENAEIYGVKADYPLDNPEQFQQSEMMIDRLKTESRLLCGYAENGTIEDFPILQR